MTFNQSKKGWLIWLILIAFFIKGAFLAVSFAIFEGQDEARHYNTIQLLNEKNPGSKIEKVQTDEDQDKEDLSTYRFSEEIRQTAKITDNHILRDDDYNTMLFSGEYAGKNEHVIDENNKNAINKIDPPDATGKNGQDLYHKAGSLIEKSLSNRNIFERFYSIRLFSVFLATVALALFYISVRKIGFSKNNSLLLAAIISFQPNFSFYTTNINYAPLIFVSFALFTLGGVLYLKNSLNWKNILIMLLAIVIGMKTKAVAIVLIIALIFILAFEVYKKINLKFKNPKTVTVFTFCISTIIIFTFFGKYLPLSEFNSIGSLFKSLWEYIDETISIGKFGQSSKSYWGLIGWTDSLLIEYARQFIWFIQAFSVIGLVMYFFNKDKLPKFLPEKKYSVFLLGMIAALQLGVRLAGWKYFDKTGDLGLGAPGRYFLPNVMAHIVLVYVGIGMLLARFKKEKYFALSLKIGLVSMFCLCMYLIFNVIIYRYYLL